MIKGMAEHYYLLDLYIEIRFILILSYKQSNKVQIWSKAQQY